MIYASFKADGSVSIKDGEKIIKFDKFGNDVSHSLSMNDMSHFQPCNTVSILTSSGSVKVAVFDVIGTMTEIDGTLNSMMNLVTRGGFLRRLTRKGVSDGISYTQVLFLYTKETRMEDIMKCLIS